MAEDYLEIRDYFLIEEEVAPSDPFTFRLLLLFRVDAYRKALLRAEDMTRHSGYGCNSNQNANPLLNS